MVNRVNEQLREAIHRSIPMFVRIPAVLGNENNLVPAPGGQVYVRYPEPGGYSQAQAVNKPLFPTSLIAGTAVWVTYDFDKELAVLGPATKAQKAAGINPWTNDLLGDITGGFLDLSMAAILRCQPTAPPSMEVTVKAFIYMDSDGVVHAFEGAGEGAGTAVDLTSFVPGSASEHCVAGVFLKTDETIEVVASTPRSTSDPLRIPEDLQECVDGRSAGSHPVWFWRLVNDMTAVTDEYSFLDGRQWINTGGGSGGGAADVTIPIQRSWFGI